MEQQRPDKLTDILRFKKKTDREIIEALEGIIHQQMMYGGDLQEKLEYAIVQASKIPFVYP